MRQQPDAVSGASIFLMLFFGLMLSDVSTASGERSAVAAVVKKRGRPTTIGATTRLALRFPDGLVEAMDAWADAAGVTRSEAARRLIEAGLKQRPLSPKKRT